MYNMLDEAKIERNRKTSTAPEKTFLHNKIYFYILYDQFKESTRKSKKNNTTQRCIILH